MSWFTDNGYAPPESQSPGPDWVQLDNGEWLPPDHPLAQEWLLYQQTNPGGQGPAPPAHGGNNAPGNDGLPQPVPPPQNPLPTQGGAPAGWDPTKWADQSHTTPKYVIGRILQKYPSTPDGLRQALGEIQQAFPGASISGSNGDRLTIPGLGTFDVGRGFAQGGNQGWQWLPQSEQQAGPQNPSNPSNPGNPGNPGAPSGFTNEGQPIFTPVTPGGPAGPTTGQPPVFTPPTAPGASSWTPQAFQMGPAVTTQTIRGQGQGQTYQPSSVQSPLSTDGPPQYSGSQVASGFSPTERTGQSVSATGSMAPLQTPKEFSYGQPSPGTFTSEPRLNAAAQVDPMRATPDFAYTPLQSSQEFKLPTGQAALEQDPGYQFRLDQGRKALEQSAAGRGLLRTGGTLKGINAFGQEMASQEYGNVVNRARDAYALNQGVRQSEQAQQFGQGLSTAQQNEAQKLARFNAELAASGQNFQQAATQQGMNAAQGLAAYQANLAGQQQGYSQAANTSQMNATNALNAYAANAANFNAGAQRDLAAQQSNQANVFNLAGLNAQQQQTAAQMDLNAQLANQASGFNYAGLNSQNLTNAAQMNLQAQLANQANAFNYAGLNSQNYNVGADREQQAAMQNAANALAAQQFNANYGLNVNQQNNAFGFQGAQFNAQQAQQDYMNQYNAANQAQAYEMQQQGLNQSQQQINLTADQQRFMQGLTGQQQQWMQWFMEQGQSWDEAYRQLALRAQYGIG